MATGPLKLRYSLKDTYKIKVNSECNVNDSKVKFDVFYFLNDTLLVKKYKC